MGYKKALEVLGRGDAALPAEPDAPEEAGVEGDQPGDHGVGDDRNQPGEPAPSVDESSNAIEMRLENLKSKVEVLEETRQRNGEAIGEELHATRDRIAELEGKVGGLESGIEQDATESKVAELEGVVEELKVTVAQAEDMAAELREMRGRLDRAEEEVAKGSACPGCGKLVGWSYQKVMELPESEFKEKTNKWASFPLNFDKLFSQKVVRFKKCLACGHIERIGG